MVVILVNNEASDHKNNSLLNTKQTKKIGERLNVSRFRFTPECNHTLSKYTLLFNT